jgi:hypothetical protein
MSPNQEEAQVARIMENLEQLAKGINEEASADAAFKAVSGQGPPVSADSPPNKVFKRSDQQFHGTHRDDTGPRYLIQKTFERSGK